MDGNITVGDLMRRWKTEEQKRIPRKMKKDIRRILSLEGLKQSKEFWVEVSYRWKNNIPMIYSIGAKKNVN